MTFSEWCAAEGYDEPKLTPKQRGHLQAAFERDVAGSPETSVAIAAAVDRYSSQVLGNADKIAKLDAIGNEAIEKGWSLKETELALMRHARMNGTINGIPAAPGAMMADVLAASLMVSAGMAESTVGPVFGEQVANVAFSKEHRGMSLHGLVRTVLAAHGKRVPTGRVNESDIRAAFEVSRPSGHSGSMLALGPSTMSLPGVLSNYANKAALASFGGVASTWQTFCKVTDLRDFKPQKSFRLTGSGTYEQVAPGGLIKHGSLTEAEYDLQADTFGKLIAIDRRDWINDDLSMFSQVPIVLGRMAAVALEKSIYLLILENAGDFFGTDDKNISTGAGSALGTAGLAAAAQIFEQQLDSNNDPVMITPAVLLTAPKLSSTGRSLMADSTMIQGTATALRGAGNEWANYATPVSSPFLAESTALHENADDDSWYLLTGPGDYSVVQVGFVGGQRFPHVEQAVMDFDRLGLAMRSYWDYGCSFFEPKGGVLSVGHA